MLIPLFYYGSEHHWILILTHIITYNSIGYRYFCNFRDMLTGSVYCRDAYELSRLQRRATLNFLHTFAFGYKLPVIRVGLGLSSY